MFVATKPAPYTISPSAFFCMMVHSKAIDQKKWWFICDDNVLNNDQTQPSSYTGPLNGVVEGDQGDKLIVIIITGVPRWEPVRILRF